MDYELTAKWHALDKVQVGLKDVVVLHPDLAPIQRQIGDLGDLTTEAKDTLVAAINEAARTGGGAGSMDLRVADGYVQYSTDGGRTWQNLIAVSDLKGTKGDKGDPGEPGAPGKDGEPGAKGDKGDPFTYSDFTEAQLAALKGEKGDTGAKGDKGETGATGPKGEPGERGIQGLQGIKGEKGDPGAKGDPGKDGAPGAKGADGKDGTNGVDGHSPVVTATKVDGVTTIKVDGANIATINDGVNGTNGKTPIKGTDYWTASDKQEIIDDIQPAFYIDLEGEYGSYQCPVSLEDIKAAYEAGKSLYCRCRMGSYTATLPLFIPVPLANTWIFSGSGALSAMSFAAQAFTVAISSSGVQAEDVTLALKSDIPTVLPSPNALTVTSGSNSVTYDGSADKIIDIPSVEKIVTETAQVLPAYTNLIPISTGASGAVLNGIGYEVGVLKSNGTVISGSAFTSGFIPVKKGDIVRIKDPGAANFSLDNTIALYKADKAASNNIGKTAKAMQANAVYGGITISGDVLTWDTSSISYYFWQDFSYLRVMTSSADSIVTINEEIKESTQTVISLKPTVKVEKGNLDFAVNEPLLAGRKIVVFGDSLIGLTRDQTSVPAYAAAYTGAKVYNVGFGGCRMAKHPSNGYAAFSMWALADAVATGNYATQEAQAPSGSDYFASQLDVLKSIDFTSVDAIVIHYGTNDFAANVPLDDAANPVSTDTVCGALRYSIKKLLTAFPKIKIFISLPLYRTWNGVGAETYKNSLEKTLPEYDSAMKMAAEEYNLPTIDGHKRLGINAINAGAYLSDGTHLNDFGRRQFGELIGGYLICGA